MNNMNAELIKSIRTAIKDGDLARFSALIDAHPEALRISTVFGTWMHVAATHGELKIVAEMVKRGMDVNATGGVAGATALHSAVRHKQHEIVKYLLDIGADMDVSEPHRNPLFAAISENDLEAARLLIEHGIDPKVRYTGDSMKDMDALAFAKERGALDFVKFLQSLDQHSSRARSNGSKR
jgi:uncharacterized protein